MTQSENPIQLVTQIFDATIYAVRDSCIGPASIAAEQSIQRIRSEELLVTVNNPNLTTPSITGFGLVELPGRLQQYIPEIVLDLEKMMGGKKHEIQGDLTRTLAIAAQFPFNGYERRYSEVYTDALAAQESWLETTESPEVPFDPRTNTTDDLIKTFVGEANFYSDTGFYDWQKTIDSLVLNEMDTEATPLLQKLRDSKPHFLAMRQRFTKMNFDNAIYIVGADYRTWSQDRRAETSATFLIGSSLYARDTSSL